MADIIIDNVYWEIKSPQGKDKNTIKHNLQNTDKQSENVIIDLYRCGLEDEVAINRIKHEFTRLKSLRKLKIITKNKEIFEISK